ncbi:hypothetical protein [Streptomyces sp. bgisy034]|uniref:hypothetical protein n=1 Tax=Streptomyces sp. bgisy034 TaxID=3413774 RepID=UPI003EC118C6
MRRTALVASWLPGTESDGVPDVLRNKRPFGGRLPVTWPRREARLPVNVGDTSYGPWLPGGWGPATPAEVPEGGAATLGALGLAGGDAEQAGTEAGGRAPVTRARPIVRQRAGGAGITEAVAKPRADAGRPLLTGGSGWRRRGWARRTARPEPPYGTRRDAVRPPVPVGSSHRDRRLCPAHQVASRV